MPVSQAITFNGLRVLVLELQPTGTPSAPVIR